VGGGGDREKNNPLYIYIPFLKYKFEEYVVVEFQLFRIQGLLLGLYRCR